MAYEDDLLRIDTPENVAFGYPVAGIGSRFIAALVDTALIVLLQVVVFTLAFLIAVQIFDLAIDSVGPGSLALWIAAGLGLVSFLFLWGYYIFFEMLWNGQSPGKRWAGLRVIRLDGRPITLTESVIRNLVRLIDFLPSFYAVGVVVMFADGRSRRLGDLAAGTIVVREGRSGKDLDDLFPAQRGDRSANTGNQPEFWLPIEKLTRKEVDLIDSFLNRRGQLSNPDAVGRQVLQRVYEKMELPQPPEGMQDPVHLLNRIRSAFTHEMLGK